MTVSISKINYYALLEVSTNASTETINAAWRLAALDNHPDRAALNGTDYRESEQNMLLINQAHQTLTDPQKRRNYDLENSIVSAVCCRCGKQGYLRKGPGNNVTALCDDCWTPVNTFVASK